MATTIGEYLTPGQLVRGQLEAKGWTQRVLALVLGVSESAVNKIVQDKKPITAEMALSLADVFGVPPNRFLEIQASYELAKARITVRPDPGRATRAVLLGGLPIVEMIKRGWIQAEGVRDVATVESELARFFGVTSPDDIEILPHAAKKTRASSDVTPVQLAWLYRVKRVAEDMLVPKYSRPTLSAAVKKLSALRSAPELARKVPRILAESGVRFLLVESLPAAKIDGVCFWLDGRSPVVGLSTRYDRIDNFWFVLRHEIEHVLQNHGNGAMMFDAELEGDRAGTGPGVAEEERVANESAAEFCVPRMQMHRFVTHKAPFFAERDLLAFSRLLKVHPGLVAGQLQRATDRYDRFRRHLVPIRSFVAPDAIVDGWGDVYPFD